MGVPGGRCAPGRATESLPGPYKPDIPFVGSHPINIDNIARDMV